MKKRLYGVNRTLILFIIISLIFLGTSHFTTNNMQGAGHIGIPFIFNSWGDGGGPPGEYYSEFTLINLILDFIIYGIIALIISFGISKIKK